MMLRHIIRIKPDVLRLPLLVIAFPFSMVDHVTTAMLPVAWGGHPHKRRLLAADFYALPAALFWAAWDGEFVPHDGRKA